MPVKERHLIAAMWTVWTTLIFAAIVGMFFAPEIGRLFLGTIFAGE